MLMGAGVGLAIIGLLTTLRLTTRRGRVLVEEATVDDDARARMDAEGGAMQPMPTHIH